MKSLCCLPNAVNQSPGCSGNVLFEIAIEIGIEHVSAAVNSDCDFDIDFDLDEPTIYSLKLFILFY